MLTHNCFPLSVLGRTTLTVILTILCLAIFCAGLYCYALAFEIGQDGLAFLLFTAGILLNSLAFFIPWQLVGHSRK